MPKRAAVGACEFAVVVVQAMEGGAVELPVERRALRLRLEPREGLLLVEADFCCSVL